MTEDGSLIAPPMGMAVSLRAAAPARRSSAVASAKGTSRHALKCRRKFLRFFPGGFRDATYLAWERDYKAEAHRSWRESLDEPLYRSLLDRKRYAEIALTAVRIESRTNLLFSFEKMALRDAVRTSAGARLFAEGLFEFVYGEGGEAGFTRWCDVVERLPRRQTRVLTWPVLTVFGFIARPDIHMFLKPNVTRIAAREYGAEFSYQSRPSWHTYASLLALARRVRTDLRDLRPRDLIDIQSFMWVQGSDEYEE